MPTLLFSELDKAIAKYEGYYTPGTLAQRQFNPGNIINSKFAESYGGVTGERGFAKFPNEAAGFAAQDALLGRYIKQGVDTPLEIINKWTPPTAEGNSPQGTMDYAAFIAKNLGIGILDSVVPGMGTVASGGKQAAEAVATEIMESTTVRLAIVGLGLVFVAGGVFMFKSVRTEVINAGSGYATGGAAGVAASVGTSLRKKAMK